MMDWRVFAFMAALLFYDGVSRYRAETGAAQEAAKAAGGGVGGSLLDADELVPGTSERGMEKRSDVAHPTHAANQLHIDFCQG